MTYIETPIEEVGVIAAEQMMQTIITGKTDTIAKVLPVKLVEGDTCAPPRKL